MGLLLAAVLVCRSASLTQNMTHNYPPPTIKFERLRVVKCDFAHVVWVNNLKVFFKWLGVSSPPPPTTKKELFVVIRELQRYPSRVTAHFEDLKKTTNYTL